MQQSRDHVFAQCKNAQRGLVIVGSKTVLTEFGVFILLAIGSGGVGGYLNIFHVEKMNFKGSCKVMCSLLHINISNVSLTQDKCIFLLYAYRIISNQ